MAPWYAEGTILSQDPDLRVEASILQCEVGKNGLMLSKSKVGKKEGKAKQSRTSNKTEPSNPRVREVSPSAAANSNKYQKSRDHATHAEVLAPGRGAVQPDRNSKAKQSKAKQSRTKTEQHTTELPSPTLCPASLMSPYGSTYIRAAPDTLHAEPRWSLIHQVSGHARLPS
jgi:hypothetical protein